MEKRKDKDPYPNNHSDVNVKEDDDAMQAAECGIGRFKPAALRVCANMAAFTGFYSTNAIMTSTLTTYVNGQVTTLERHFGFSSTQTGLIMAANDVGFLSVVLLISYLANKAHIPRALGAGTIFFGVSGFVCALPYFMFGGPSPSSVDVTSGNMTSLRLSRSFSGQVCDGINNTSSDCSTNISTAGLLGERRPTSEARANSGVALVVIALGMVLQGIAKAPRGSFVSTYVDNNVDRTKTGFYMGIIIAFAVLGPGVSYGLGGVFSRIYVTLEETELHFRHPKWIGAWWLGYIAFAIGACVFALPVCLFPRQIKGGKPHKKLSTQFDRGNGLKMLINFLKGWLGALFRLITNPVYVCLLLSTCLFVFSISGGQSFTPKYIENQFSFDVWKANFAMAGMMLTIASTGTFSGGYLTKRFKMDAVASLKFSLICHVISAAFLNIMLFVKCEQPLLYNSPGDGEGKASEGEEMGTALTMLAQREVKSLTLRSPTTRRPRASEETTLSGCYDNCACDDDDYFPVCGDDGRTFFSPCHAGCLGNAGTAYANCSCIAGGTAVAGMCEYGCSMVYAYMVCFCLTAFAGTLAIIPSVVIKLRIVEDRDKALGIGLSAFMTSVTGWMLGPILFGKLIDGICIHWDKGCSGGGACRLYDNNNFRLKLYGYQTGVRWASVLFLAVAYVFCRRMNNRKKGAAEKREVNEMISFAGEEDDRNTAKSV